MWSNSVRTGSIFTGDKSMKVEIQPACPEDASFLAWVMLTAGRSHIDRGIWDIAIENTEKERLDFLQTAALTEKPHMLHHSNFAWRAS
jgi:hypothetical protein